MCSQFENKAPISQILKITDALIDEQILNYSWETNVFPYTQAPVVTRYNENNILRLMKYSLVPAWSKESKPKFSTYNARLDRPGQGNKLELIYNAPTWRIPFSQQRCLVPLTGFFESCREGTHVGNIVKFSSASDEILLAAGIWDKWTDKDTGEIIFSFAILTDDPCNYIKEVGHDRQPVFLTKDNGNIWLNSNKLETKEAYQFLKNNQEAVKYNVSNVKKLKGFEQRDMFS